MTWKRWLGYVRARVNLALRSADKELDRREERLEAKSARKPWLASDRETPTFDEAQQRVAHETGVPPTPDKEFDFDLAVQEREAHERLSRIRASMNEPGDKKKGPDEENDRPGKGEPPGKPAR